MGVAHATWFFPPLVSHVTTLLLTVLRFSNLGCVLTKPHRLLFFLDDLNQPVALKPVAPEIQLSNIQRAACLTTIRAEPDGS